MLTFAFVVTMLAPNNQPADDYIMDTGMTYEDCVQRAEDYQPTADAMHWLMACSPETATFKAVYGLK